MACREQGGPHRPIAVGGSPDRPPSNPPNQGSSGSRPGWPIDADATQFAPPPADYALADPCPICGRRHEPGPEERGGIRADWIVLALVFILVAGTFAWLAVDLGWAVLDVLARGVGSLSP